MGRVTYLSHITHGETSQRRVVSEGLNAHGLRGNHLDDSRITGLDEFGLVLNRFTGTAINLLDQLGELAGNVGGMAIQDWSITCTNLAGVVEDNDLGIEGLGSLGGIVLGVTGDVATADLLN